MPETADASKLRLLSHNDLNGFGNGGEGLALQQLPDGRRVLYMAHERAPKDFTAIDVTDPANPRVIVQTELPHRNVRSNSLAAVGDILLVAYQTTSHGLTPAGMGVYDIGDPEAPRQIGFFDTSGPRSKGVHCLWWVDGRYATLSTGAADFNPRNPLDDQFYMIVDMSDPTRPREAGRWWLPGVEEGDAAPPPTRHTQFDMGFRVHNGNIYPQRPDRAYLGYLDAGVIILDISDISSPSMISRLDYHPPLSGIHPHRLAPVRPGTPDRDGRVYPREGRGLAQAGMGHRRPRREQPRHHQHVSNAPQRGVYPQRRTLWSPQHPRKPARAHLVELG